ncbi:MAG: hypothetical protein J6D42_07255 [Clostridia bacterium]|nr:hypothetical protein [Clostridia bacterium]
MKKTLKSLLIFFACVTLFGCTNEEIPKDETIQKEDIVYITKQITHSEAGGFFGMKTFMETATIENVTYCFEKSVSEEDRVYCIEQTSKLLENIDTGKDLTICIYDKTTYDNEYASDGFVYTSVRDWQSAEYLTVILRAIYGEYCNYGTAYGYANYLLGNTETSDLKFEADFEFYDLNDLCFHPNFATDEQIDIVKSISTAFVKEYIKTNGEESFIDILKASGDVKEIVKAKNALEGFYEKNGIKTELPTIIFGPGGEAFDYTVICEYASIYIIEDFIDTGASYYPEYTFFDGFLNNNYVKTMDYFIVNVEQMKKYQYHFGLDYYDNSLEIMFLNNTEFSIYFSRPVHQIRLNSIISFMHEYIHSVTMLDWTQETEKWESEGLAAYYEFLYNEYALPFWYYDRNNGAEIYGHTYILDYIEKSGRPVETVDDLRELDNIYSYLTRKHGLNYTYTSGASFISYLINQFGEREVLDYMLVHHSLKKLTDQTFDELVEDWKDFLEENYWEYGRK